MSQRSAAGRATRAVPSGRTVSGRLEVPPSKSVTHRFFNLALLSGSPVVVDNPLDAEDTRLFREALRAAGFTVAEEGGSVALTPPAVPPRGPVEILCGNAGTLFRFLTASLAALPGEWRLDGVPRLRERPVGPLVAALRRLGADIRCPRREGYAPLVIRGGTLGSGGAGRTELEAGESSQYLSALLMAALRAPRELEIEVRSLTSSPYVEITLRAIELFGGRYERLAGGGFRVFPSRLGVERVRVEGDFSAAAYPAAAAALAGGKVRLAGLDPASRQGDRQFLALLERMGAGVVWEGDELEVSRGELRAVSVDLGSMPDQVPTLAALAPFARGLTRISNVAHLRIKESDRLRAMATELRKLGAEVEEEPAGLVVPGLWAERGPGRSEPVVVEPHGDHRIAMSLALVGLRRPGVVIADPGVVEKSYPGFWQDLERLLE